MKRFVFIFALSLLYSCVKEETKITPETYETTLEVAKYNEYKPVFVGVCEVSKNGLVVKSKGGAVYIEMNFSENFSLDKYNVGKYIDEYGIVYTTTYWFDAPNTSNTSIGFKNGTYFEFCGMDKKQNPICLNGYIGVKPKN